MNHKLNFFTALVLAAGALTLSATGCELIASVDRGKIPGAGGGGAGTGGGTGGTTTSSTTGTGGATGGGGTGGTSGSTTSSSSSSSSTTTTAPPTCGTAGGTTCTDASMCPAAAECTHAVCNTTSNCCEAANDTNGATAATQTDGDCKTAVCDGNGGTTTVNDNSDLPADANDCSVGACNAGNAAQNPKMLGTTCASSGGSVCDGAGNCVACNTDADCAGNTSGNTTCSAHACVAPKCTDTVQNGFETDVDCGGIASGSGCNTCADGKHCAVNTDCGSSSICKVGVCTAVSCTDTVKDGTETDVDCGGATCRGQNKLCAVGKTCAVSADCASLFCNPSTLKCATPTCTDTFANGTESDVDCGGTCATKCANGKLCGGGTDCASGVCNSGICGTLALGIACTTGANCGSGNCVDGVCCSASSCSSCQACSATLKQDGLTNGLCGNVKDGTDPHTSCPVQAASTCGNTGTCTAGACTQYAPGTACGTSASCASSNQFTPAQTCPGAGAACSTVSAAACSNNLVCADGTSCKSSCNADTDCVSGYFCNSSHACSLPLANGATCSANSQCSSGNCNGTVCAAACSVNADCSSNMCYAGACVATSINGCTIGTATDMTGQANVAISFASFSYTPQCVKVTAGTVVTFNGSFASHPLLGGQDVSGTGVPAASGPFVPVTNTGTTAPFTMSTAATFPYYCTAHVGSGMEGVVFVVP
jgi:plastocyanin